MRRDTVSVIVPIYNTRDYVERCVNALTAQRGVDLELILVDDGSTDGSGRICDELSAENARIRVIHQKNGGVSRARNAGLDAAGGEWICFADSDDIPQPGYLSFLFEKRAESGADLAACGYRSFGGETEFGALPMPQTLMTSREYLNNVLTGQYGLHLSVWGWIFPAAWGLRFAEDLRYGEDSLFLCQALAKARSVYYEAAPLYLYETGREGSTFVERKLAKTLSDRSAWQRIAPLFADDEALSAQFDRILCDLSLQCVRLADREGDADAKARLKEEAAQYYARLQSSPHISRKDRLRLRLLLLSPVKGAELWEKIKK